MVVRFRAGCCCRDAVSRQFVGISQLLVLLLPHPIWEPLVVLLSPYISELLTLETTMPMAGVVTKKEKSSTFVGRLGSIAVYHYPASKDNFGIMAIAKKVSISKICIFA